MVTINDNYAAGIVRVNTIVTIKRRANVALHGGQAEIADFIVLEHKLRIGRAKHTFCIEQYDWSIGQLTSRSFEILVLSN